jgi:4'-phosphopantetheinyl transferase
VVAVWNLWIGGTPDDETARALLSDDELARASRFVFDLHRNRYLAGRLALRELLGRYLGRAASEVRFSYSTHGKPELPGETLRFNVAHSDDLAIIGLTEHDRLGVDVECIRELRDIDGVARTVFSQRELEAFHALPDSSKTQGFFSCWTRKEAFVKAVGDGLSQPLDVFDVTLRAGEAWSLFDIAPLDGWVGAVAVENPQAVLKHAGWLGAKAEPES